MVFKKGHVPWCKDKKLTGKHRDSAINNLGEYAKKGHISCRKGKILSKKTRKRMSESGKKKVFTYEHRKNMSIAQKRRKRVPFTNEHKRNLSISMEGRESFWKGKKMPCSGWNKNIPCSKEHKEKISKANKGRFSLEKNPAWLGGISFEPYTKEFNNKFKRRIRKRDNQICMLCGIHREKLSRALDVHHIDYNKKLTIPQNCISLCQKCNIKVNKNRPHWIKFFQSLLSEKYGYKYSENNEIIVEVNQNRN